MPTSFGEPLTKLRAVPIVECGEPLVDPRTLSKRIRMATTHPKFGHLRHRPEVRASVARMIAHAADSLPDGLVIEIIEGVRPITQQRHMYESLRSEFAAQHPQWSKSTLNRYTNTLCAPPDDKCPPPHTTGGAVDLCFVDAATGERLDVTSPYEWNESSAPTALPGLTKQARANRDMMSKLLAETGLTNYIGEWWHWSYGDSGWALRTGAPHAIYGRLDDSAFG